MLAIAVFSLLILAAFIFMLIKERKSKVAVLDISLADISKITGNILTFPIYVTNCIAFGVYFLIQSSIGKKLLEDCFGYSSQLAATYTLVLVIASMTGSGLSGLVSRMLNNRRKPLMIAGASLALSFSVLLIMAIKGILGDFVVLPAFIMLGLSAVGLPVGIANARELNFPKFTGTAIGFLNAGCYATVAILITVAGSMLDLFGEYAVTTETSVAYPHNAYIAVLMMCMVVSVFSVFGSFLIKETCGINISPVEIE